MIITGEHCQPCGACCQTRPIADSTRAALGLPVVGTWVNCTAEDVARMSKRSRSRLVPVKRDGEEMLATPLRADGTCGFLNGKPGERVSCAIYDRRPTICRLYEPGSEYCRASRREIGLPA